MVDIEKRIEFAKRRLVDQRNYRRVRSRALTKLAKAHREEYLLLMEKEKESDEAMGKKWLDIAGTTSNTHPVESYKDATEGASYDPSDSGANQSYYGGEE